jgi:hypothetical protein
MAAKVKSTTMVRYRVKAERVQENEELVRAVYAELAETRPDGLRYTTHKLDDGVTFVHTATTELEEGADSPLPQVQAFKEFQAEIRDRCDDPPQVSQTETIGSYGR